MIQDAGLDSQMEGKAPLFPLAGVIKGPASGDPHPTQCWKCGANLALSKTGMTFPDIFWVSLFAGVSGEWKKDRAL